MNIDFPFHFSGRGRTALAGDADHIRDMIEQVLFTSPGERVNRPDFGVGIKRLCFDGNSREVAAAIQLTIQGSLQRWLGDLIEVRGVSADAQDATLTIQVQYVVRRTGELKQQPFMLSPNS